MRYPPRPALLIERLPGVPIERYDEIARRLDFPSRMPDGLIFQTVGHNEEYLFGTSIFATEDSALRWLGGPRLDAAVAARGEREPVAASRSVGVVDHVHASFELPMFATGGTVDDYGLVAVVMDAPASHGFNYYSGMRAMGFPARWPEGLLIHFAGINGSSLHVVTVFKTRELAESFYRDEVMPNVRVQLGATEDNSAETSIAISWFGLHALAIDTAASQVAEWIAAGLARPVTASTDEGP